MKVSGVYPVLPTPFDASGAIDDSGMDAIVDFVVDCGVDGAVFPGLASEYDMLSLDERIGLIGRISARIDGRIGFIIGGSSPDVEESLALIRAGKAAGAAGAMVMTPSALAGDNDALADHYRTLGEVGLPLMLQNAPRPMGAGLSAEDVIAVVGAVPAIHWVKEENMPCGQRISAIRAAAPDHLLGVFGGAGGRYITDELARGAIGTMPAAELPEAHVALMAAHLTGDGDAVRTHYERMLPLLMMQAVFRWRLTKEVLHRRGLIADAFTRAPGPELDEGDQRELDRILARIDDWTGIGVVQGLKDMGAMDDVIERLDVFTVTIPRDVPYLGALGPGEEVNAAGYIVRRRNGTIYPTVDRSVVVRVTSRSGLVGWGETYGLVAPGAIHELVDDVIAPILIGRSAHDVEVIWEDLYDLMRVRGYQGGFWLDAMAAVDIALWDIHARAAGLPLCRLLGGQRRETIPAYVSGLPEPTLEARCALAKRFVDQGFDAIKFAGVVSFDGIEAEAKALRAAIGPDVKLMVDLHWMYSAAEAVALIRRLEPHDLYFAEAPVKPEDVAGLADVAARVATPIAAGEEWRSVFDARPRLEARAVSIVQPEMGHTGITQFMRIARLAEAHHVRVMPHATIGVGIFAAASLHAAAAVRDLPYHEYQHSILPRSAQLLDGRLSCTAGAFALPEGPGLGVAPNAAFWNHVMRGRQ